MSVHGEDVPPTQYLAMEVLAARFRLGESLWTFPTACRPALNALAERGWVRHKSGVTEGTERAWLTDAGVAAWALDQDYEAPSPPSPAPTQYDPLTTLREVQRVLDRHEHTKRGLRQQRADAIVALAGTLGFHDALTRRFDIEPPTQFGRTPQDEAVS